MSEITSAADVGPSAHKPLHRRMLNRVLHVMARFCPGSTSLRPALHRARGVRIGNDVFIGDDVFIDNEYPECIEIGDHVQISIRAVLVAHTRGPGRVIVEPNVFIGPLCVVACSAGRILRIGTGAVIGPGCVVTRSVAPGVYLTQAAPRTMGVATVPLPLARNMDEFIAGLRPWSPPRAGGRPGGGGAPGGAGDRTG